MNAIARQWIAVAFASTAISCTHHNKVPSGYDLGMADLTGSTDDQGTTNGDGNTCAATSQKATALPLDLLLVEDTSGSMDYDNKWINVKAAIEAFVTDPKFAGLGLGLQYFPARAACDVNGYATPAVGIATLPGNASAIVASLEGKQMSGGTPMVNVLEGTTAYLKSWIAMNPTHRVALILATDGTPDTICQDAPDGGLANNLSSVQTVAMNSATGSPKIPVFVIGVGANLTELNQIANAGGTNSAFIVDTAQDVQAVFLAALNSIRRTAVACQYDIPPPPTGTTIDINKVNVQFAPASGASQSFVYVGDVASCSRAPTNGWYYDDPVHPTKIQLCPDTCNAVQQVSDAQINILFGCQTIIG